MSKKDDEKKRLSAGRRTQLAEARKITVNSGTTGGSGALPLPLPTKTASAKPVAGPRAQAAAPKLQFPAYGTAPGASAKPAAPATSGMGGLLAAEKAAKAQAATPKLQFPAYGSAPGIRNAQLNTLQQNSIKWHLTNDAAKKAALQAANDAERRKLGLVYDDRTGRTLQPMTGANISAPVESAFGKTAGALRQQMNAYAENPGGTLTPEQVAENREKVKLMGQSLPERIAKTLDSSNIGLQGSLDSWMETGTLAAYDRAEKRYLESRLKPNGTNHVTVWDEMALRQKYGGDWRTVMEKIYQAEKSGDTGAADAIRQSYDANSTAINSDGLRKQDEAAQQREEAKEGLGTAGRFGLDALRLGADTFGRASIGTLTGGAPAFTATNFITGAGQGADKARRLGADAQTAEQYGNAVGAANAAIEKLGGVGGSKFAGTTAEKVLPAAVQKFGQTAAGKVLGNAADEGLEEALQYEAERQLSNAMLGTNERFSAQEMAANAAAGALMGGIFGGARALGDRINQRDAPKLEIRYGEVPGARTAQMTQERAQAGRATTDIPAAQDAAQGITGQKNSSAEAEPVQVGRATTIQHPYSGKTPVNTQAATEGARVEIDSGLVRAAQAEIAQAETQPGFKATIKKYLQSLFAASGGQRTVTVEGVRFGETPYDVQLNPRISAKIASDPGMSAEKLAAFYTLDDAVKRAEFVGSGIYGKNNTKAENVIRYDYFETPLTIAGTPYIMAFDVEVHRNANNMRTYRVINEMTLTPRAELPETEPASPVGVSESLHNNSIPPLAEKINTPAAKTQALGRAAAPTLEIRYGEVPAARKNRLLRDAAEKVRGIGDTAYRNLVSGQAELEKIASMQENKRPAAASANDYVQMARTAGTTVDAIASTGMVDLDGNRIGNSWLDTVGKLSDEELARLNEYRLHLHNIDRMNIEAEVREELDQTRAALDAFRMIHPTISKMTAAQLDEAIRSTPHDTATSKALYEYRQLLADEAKLATIKNKPVLAKQDERGEFPYTARESMNVVRQMEAEHPELVQLTTAAENWHSQFMREWAVKSGLMSEKQLSQLQELYPHYVQTFRAQDSFGKTGEAVSRRNMNTGSPIKRAVGDISEIIPFQDAEMNQVNSIVKAARRNELFLNLYNWAKKNPQRASPYMRILTDAAEAEGPAYGSMDEMAETWNNAMQKNGDTHTITAMENGKPIQMEVNESIYAGLQNLYGQDKGSFEKTSENFAKYTTKPFKTLTTGANPFFVLTNFPKDFQTAYINTASDRKTLAGFLYDAANTAVAMKRGTDDWQAFKALGGRDTGFYQNEKGFTDSMKAANSKTAKAWNKFKELSTFVGENTEALWRFNEYRTMIRKYGDTPEGRRKAMQAAADVTTNFSRSAPYTKVAENYVAYLNASIQGLDKTARTLKNHPVRTLARAAELITIPTMLLWLLNHDNEDYQNLDNRTKDNYFIIPKGGGKFWKIPKSREYGVAMGALFERFLRLAEGEDAQTAFEGIGNQFATNLAPSNPVTDNIFKTVFIDLPNNRDFAGRSIVPERLQGLSPENQVEYTTSGAGKVLAKGWNSTLGIPFGKISPIQADYLVDSNLGFVGDAIVAGTQRSDNVLQTLDNIFLEPIRRKTTADTLYQSGVTDAFYKELDAAEKAKNDENLTEEIPARAITPEEKYYSELMKVSDQISDLRKQEREISASELTEAEKERQVRELRRQMVTLAKGAEADAKAVREKYEKTYVQEISHMSDDLQERARLANSEYGTPYAAFAQYDDRLKELKKPDGAKDSDARETVLNEIQADSSISDKEKEGLSRKLLLLDLGDSRIADWSEKYNGIVSPDVFIRIADKYAEIDRNADEAADRKAAQKQAATQILQYLDTLNVSPEVRTQLADDFKIWSMTPVKPEAYNYDMLTNQKVKAQASAIEATGLDIGVFNEVYATADDFKADKDANGKTIDDSRKKKIVNYIRSRDDLTPEQQDLIIKTFYKDASTGSSSIKPKTLKKIPTLKITFGK